MKKINKQKEVLAKQAEGIQKTSLKMLKKFPSDRELKKSFPQLYNTLKPAQNLLKTAAGASKMSGSEFKKFINKSQKIIEKFHNDLQTRTEYKSCIFICLEDWKTCRSKCDKNNIWDPCWGECNWAKFLCDLNCFFKIEKVSIVK